VLINDNATGTLTSETEEPFQSVNASTSVATTSFGGYSSAGTKMVITPQISEGEHLKLEYEITLSSFGEDASDALPPSRQTNTLTSEATIPDGFTIIVGGLTREDFNESIDRVPLLGSLPLLEYLFSNRSKTRRSATLFVFIHATILRDDKFESLKLLSAQAARRAELDDTYPTSEAVEIP
jgi:general secretion pathway protein D